jgi:hypothetical protein
MNMQRTYNILTGFLFRNMRGVWRSDQPMVVGTTHQSR